NALKKQISSSALTAPLLMLSVMLLLWGSEFYVKRAVSADENVFLSLCIVQIIAFFAPSLLYYQIKHRKLSTSLLVSPLKMSHGVFIVFASLLFFTGQILLKYFMFKFFGITTESSTIQLGENVPVIQPILAFCVVPAVCEEFFFRGIILSEYRSHGLFKAVIISSVFFAFSHFSFTGFPIYLFAGIMFAVLTAVSRSVFPGMILHFANNLLDLYAGDFLNELSWLDSDMYFFRFVLVLLFLISLWRVFSRMQHIYFQYSENPPKEALGGVKPKAKGAFRSWTLLLPICAYLIITAITS
ncbi:MAG: CPBP family intramembrane metalloprotease, partial [Clostridia bacterium]|nr:CPBP family intramembrane metalloprotease [Clostridia bacterium]